MKRPHAWSGAAPLAVVLSDRGPAASRATHPSDHRTDRPPTVERLLGARRHPLDDAADRAPAVPDDPDDDARARPPGHRPCPLAPLLRGGWTPSGEAGMVPLRLTLLGVSTRGSPREPLACSSVGTSMARTRRRTKATSGCTTGPSPFLRCPRTNPLGLLLTTPIANKCTLQANARARLEQDALSERMNGQASPRPWRHRG
jgi:hypothetical protein